MTSTITVTGPSIDTPAASSTPTVTTEESPAPTCSTDGSAAITAAAAQIPTPLPDSGPDAGWVFHGETNYNTCFDLSYAALETAGGTGSSPSQLLMFHLGRFVGRAIACNAAFQTVTGSSPTSVNVTYRYLNAGDPTANPTGRADVVFVWDASQVVMHGSLPYEVTQGKC
ncbi:LppP/LprE family lipoprotein [Gordonia rhizosphera]|uniref:LppP/LprE family lipoprotein n=1 Tax=Gordonia rhizosphera TaxID=83341 RepID=UPI0012F6F310|nr:LppP/LprE family lipoprotein [Gordonia rhizosphera]